MAYFTETIRHRFVSRTARDNSGDFSGNNNSLDDFSDNNDKCENIENSHKNNNKKVDKILQKSDEKPELKQDKKINQIYAKSLITDAVEYISLTEGEKTVYRGLLPGTYVRVVLSGVPCEFVENFDSRFPVVLGECRVKEEQLGFLQVTLLKKDVWLSLCDKAKF